jgi:tripartite-type tricarboxylate transporter receptor subunit TctC
MTLARRLFLRLAAAAFAGFAGSHLATAQTYPLRPITLISPYAAGGAGDFVARLIAERIGASLGQPCAVENVPGANGSIGIGRLARAAPDGYTLGIGSWGTHVVNAALYALPYSVLDDFEPISVIADIPVLIVSRKSIPAHDLRGLIAWLKANPERASQGHPGVGSGGHLAGLMFQQMTGTRFVLVPYRGSVVSDLVAGQIDLQMDPVGTTLPQVRAGAITAYAVAAKNRVAVAPEIPTVDEAGLPGLYVSGWWALYAPKSTPKDIVLRLNRVVVDALADQSVRSRIVDLGAEVAPRDLQTPEALAAYQRAEIDKWWPIVKAANLKAD